MITEIHISNFDLITLFRKLEKRFSDVNFLYSGGEHDGNRWSILAFNSRFPFGSEPRGSSLRVEDKIEDLRLSDLKEITQDAQGELPFERGWIGYLSYDYGLRLHGIKPQGIHDLGLPDAFFRYYDEAIVYDHEKEMCYFASQEHDESFIREIWNDKMDEAEKIAPLDFHPVISRDEYDRAFEQVKRHIYDGDVYQLNLTHRLEADFSGSSADLFAHLANKNPAPMSAFIKGDDFEIISCSPERFLTLEGNKLSTFPIKGTASLENSEKDLLENEKEEAELNMITDLLRNDIGMVSEVGSVKVEKHRAIMKLASVMHTYSHVSGNLKKDLGPFEAFLTMFPGGSITGCPKKRAMEIINDLEKYSRSVYTGCIGYLSDLGRMDFDIAIRTLVRKGNKLYLGVGGGIVADSQKDMEYEETLQKARGFMI